MPGYPAVLYDTVLYVQRWTDFPCPWSVTAHRGWQFKYALHTYTYSIEPSGIDVKPHTVEKPVF
jgi:hypothetical protein